MASWLIKEWDGLNVKAKYHLPGHLSEQEIETVLQRLVCRNLTVSEVLTSSRRKDDPERTGQLERIGHGSPVTYGHSHLHYTAEYKMDG
ncbi:hypothetical protein [Roseibium aggregatum]|uniref:Uncharacterized protein n=1 Tax=Roseibium aggregatum TaxID=187304 RepID=A0A926S319_9HYPH|nr:hypothetical protein [Roseibium aggregatum]MBD1544853.1 hypothetical protein [Roseibium aggregatum]